MEALQKRISDRLATNKYCSAFENELERIWPREKELRAKRVAAIEAFAKRNGWSVKISDPGIRATFRKVGAPVQNKTKSIPNLVVVSA